MEECLDVLQAHIACRKTEISTLYSLISSKTSMPQSIFAFGHSGTGKSLVIRSVLEYLNYNFTFVNCIENPTMKYLLERIINDLYDNIENDSIINKEKIFKKCNNMYEFITHLKAISNVNNSNIVIVFENCNRLSDIDGTLLSSFLRLRELSKINVCTILISDIVWEKFKIKNEMAEPIKMYFPQYTYEEVIKILMLLEANNEEIDNDIYTNYLDLFLSVYFRYCRDLRELHYMAQLNFEKYMEPIKSGQCDKTNIQFLWKYINQIFKSNLEVIYLRVSADELIKREKFAHDINSAYDLVQSFELPFFSKYMLVASFLASYIPPKLDKQLFQKEGERKTKKKNKIRFEKKSNSLLKASPRPFTLDRMLGIFCFIYEQDVDINAVLLMQISTMCRLGLLTPMGLNKLDELKYKCSVNFEFIKVIAQMIQCDIMGFLKAI